jgi:hypothetical protein
MMTFQQQCILPRRLFGPTDPLYCVEFLKYMAKEQVPVFSLPLVNSIVCLHPAVNGRCSCFLR